MEIETEKLRFDQWMRAVDIACKRLAGVSVYDLPEICYADLYEDDVKPQAAARKAIRVARDEDDL